MVVQVDAIQEGLKGFVTGVDLSKPLADGELADIKAAWLDLGVLAFPDQALSPEQQAAFSAQFGELDVYPFMTPVQSHPNVIPIIKEPEAKMNFGGGWHTDTSYLAKPPKATVLYALETPPEGGDTLFADARAAFDTLSEEHAGNLVWVNRYLFTEVGARGQGRLPERRCQGVTRRQL